MAGPGSRQIHIETLRGAACLLLVAYHTIGDDSAHGLRVADDSVWRMLTDLFVHVRMPLFSFISGFVLMPVPTGTGELGPALLKKLRRLGLPLVTVSILFWIATQLIGPVDRIPLTDVFWLPYKHFWFLQATLILMAVTLTTAALLGGARQAALALLPLAAVVFVAAPDWRPDVFSSAQAVYLAPFFLAGLTCRVLKADERLAGAPARALLGFAVGLFLLHAASVTGLIAMDTHRQTPFGLLLGVSTCLALMALRPKVGWLAAIGTHSYAIYLFHVFFTAGLRTAANGLLPGLPLPVVFAVSLAGGVLLPIVVEAVVSRFRLPALLLLGVDRSKARRSAPPVPRPAE